MKIEIKNVKFAEFASTDSNCFTATVYIDGKKAGEVHDDGNGGGMEYNPWSMAHILNEHAKTLPKMKMEGYADLEMDPDLIIGDLFEKWLTEKESRATLKRKLKNNILFVKDKKVWVVKVPNANLTSRPIEPELKKILMEKYKADEILNTIPFEDAIATYIKLTNGGNQ